jgi:hypothetical protein
LGVVAIFGRYDALTIRSSFACTLPWLVVLDVIASVVLVHVGNLVFLVPVGKLVISDAKIVLGGALLLSLCSSYMNSLFGPLCFALS